MANDVKFVRIRGKVVPIKSKAARENSLYKKRKRTLKKYAPGYKKTMNSNIAATGEGLSSKTARRRKIGMSQQGFGMAAAIGGILKKGKLGAALGLAGLYTAGKGIAKTKLNKKDLSTARKNILKRSSSIDVAMLSTGTGEQLNVVAGKLGARGFTEHDRKYM